MARDYRRLEVYRTAHELVLDVYTWTRDFPAEERLGMTSQLRRAASSVPANIVEGASRDSQREFVRFLGIAYSSLAEVNYFLDLAKDLHWLPSEAHQAMIHKVIRTKRKLHHLKQALS